jgi:hypothetical protein
MAMLQARAPASVKVMANLLCIGISLSLLEFLQAPTSPISRAPIASIEARVVAANGMPP